MSCLGGFNLLPQTFFCASVTSSNQEMSKCTGSPKRAWDVEMHVFVFFLIPPLFLVLLYFFCFCILRVLIKRTGEPKRSIEEVGDASSVMRVFLFSFPSSFLGKTGSTFQDQGGARLRMISSVHQEMVVRRRVHERVLAFLRDDRPASLPRDERAVQCR